MGVAVAGVLATYSPTTFASSIKGNSMVTAGVDPSMTKRGLVSEENMILGTGLLFLEALTELFPSWSTISRVVVQWPIGEHGSL